MGVIVMGAIVGCAAPAALAVGSVPYDFFPVSYWVSPPAEDARYAELAECGFTLTFGGDADLSHKHGMRSIVADGRIGGAERRDESCAIPWRNGGGVDQGL